MKNKSFKNAVNWYALRESELKGCLFYNVRHFENLIYLSDVYVCRTKRNPKKHWHLVMVFSVHAC